MFTKEDLQEILGCVSQERENVGNYSEIYRCSQWKERYQYFTALECKIELELSKTSTIV